MTVETTTKDKQITIDVPEDRVAEFYAFYGHFLAATPGRRRRGGGPRGGPHPRHHGPHGHRCGPHREHGPADESVEPTQPEQAAPGADVIA